VVDALDRTGQVFGRLEVLYRVKNRKSGGPRWRVRCSCPAHREKDVLSWNLLNGHVKSCGCLPKGAKPNPSLVCVKCGSTERYSNGQCAPCKRAYVRLYQATKYLDPEWVIANKVRKKLAARIKYADPTNVAIKNEHQRARRKQQKIDNPAAYEKYARAHRQWMRDNKDLCNKKNRYRYATDAEYRTRLHEASLKYRPVCREKYAQRKAQSYLHDLMVAVGNKVSGVVKPEWVCNRCGGGQRMIIKGKDGRQRLGGCQKCRLEYRRQYDAVPENIVRRNKLRRAWRKMVRGYKVMQAA
jgi:hypothetical protein